MLNVARAVLALRGGIVHDTEWSGAICLALVSHIYQHPFATVGTNAKTMRRELYPSYAP